MGVRETLNKNKMATAVAGGCLLLLGAVVIIKGNASGIPGPLTRAYYSDDDGKSFFADDANKVAPFDHNGKPADRAYVYQCGSGKPFVLYLERYEESTRSKLTAAMANKSSDTAAAAAVAELRGSGIEIKKPGEKNWVSPTSPVGVDTVTPKCPDGGAPHGVYP